MASSASTRSGVAVSLDAAQLAALREGIALEEGVARVIAIRRSTAAEVARLPRADRGRRSSQPLAWYRVTLATGWKRQVRRMFAAVDAVVERLVRVRMGPLRLGDLPTGAMRALTADERRAFDQIAASPARRPS